MKFFATIMLVLAFGLSVACSQDFSDDNASLDAQHFMDRVLQGQVDDEDDEILDMDDALSKLRMLRKVYRIVSEVEAEDLLHPKKRFIDIDFPPNIIDKIKEAMRKVAEMYKEAQERGFRQGFGIDLFSAVRKAIPYLHSGMSLDACKKAIAAVATDIYGPKAPPVASQFGSDGYTFADFICGRALTELKKLAG